MHRYGFDFFCLHLKLYNIAHRKVDPKAIVQKQEGKKRQRSSTGWIARNKGIIETRSLFLSGRLKFAFACKVPSIYHVFVTRRMIVNMLEKEGIELVQTRKVESFLFELVKSMCSNREDKESSKIKNMQQNKTNTDRNVHFIYNILKQWVLEGIKHFMRDRYCEEKYALVIQQTYQAIIDNDRLKNEYYYVFKMNEKRDYSYSKVFDYGNYCVVGLIFEHLTSKELGNASCVNSDWFYGVFGSNTMFKIDLTRRVETIQHGRRYNYERLRYQEEQIWQRFVNVKHAYLDLTRESISTPNEMLTNRLSILRNIKILDGYYYPEDHTHLQIIKQLLDQCRDTIEKFKMVPLRADTHVHSYCFNTLNRDNYKYLGYLQEYYFQDLRLWIKFTNTCKDLNVFPRNIPVEWCKFLVNDCDCSGIEKLSIVNATFGINHNVRINNDDSKVDEDEALTPLSVLPKAHILMQMANKFVNLKLLHVRFDRKYDCNVLLLWDQLKQIIATNNTKVIVSIFRLPKRYYKQLVDEMIVARRAKVNKVEMHLDCTMMDNIQEIKRIISTQDMQWITCHKNGNETFTSLMRYLDDDHNDNDNCKESNNHKNVKNMNNYKHNARVKPNDVKTITTALTTSKTTSKLRDLDVGLDACDVASAYTRALKTTYDVRRTMFGALEVIQVHDRDSYGGSKVEDIITFVELGKCSRYSERKQPLLPSGNFHANSHHTHLRTDNEAHIYSLFGSLCLTLERLMTSTRPNILPKLMKFNHKYRVRYVSPVHLQVTFAQLSHALFKRLKNEIFLPYFDSLRMKLYNCEITKPDCNHFCVALEWPQYVHTEFKFGDKQAILIVKNVEIVPMESLQIK